MAVGAAIGLAIPATEYEDRAMGETRDQALAKARNVANNLKQNVGEKVAAYAENVVDESLMGARAARRADGACVMAPHVMLMKSHGRRRLRRLLRLLWPDPPSPRSDPTLQPV